MIKDVYAVYFSATDNTKKITEHIAKTCKDDFQKKDLLNNDLLPKKLDQNDLVVIGMPVYAGKIPTICLDMLKQLKGNKTPAIVVVSYGNRDFDDALLELSTIMEENNFLVLGAAAFISQHSIFPKVAMDRPNSKDFDQITKFTIDCLDKLKNREFSSLEITGNKPYKEAKAIPLKPSGDRTCIKCGICSKICPTKAIDPSKPTKTDKSLCISCSACIHHCPVNSRKYKGLIYSLASKKFLKDNSIDKDPSVFI